MNVVDDDLNKLSIRRINLQKKFSDYNSENGFSYELWVNPPLDHFYAKYKSDLQEIDIKMAPPLTYQS